MKIIAKSPTFGALSMGVIVAEFWSMTDRSENTETTQLVDSPYFVAIDVGLSHRLLFGIGTVLGALFAGLIFSPIGYRAGMVFMDVAMIAGLTITAVPDPIPWMTTSSRMCVGISVGALSVVIPTYVGEVSHPKIRGRLGALFPAFFTAGALCLFEIKHHSEYVSSMYVRTVGAPFARRVPFQIGLCLWWTGLHAIGLCALPETRHPDFGDGHRYSVYVSMVEFRRIENATFKRYTSPQLRDFEQIASVTGIHFQALFVGVVSMFFGHLCGVGMVTVYMNDLLRITGSDDVCFRTASAWIAVIQLFMAFAVMVTIEKVGRKNLLLFSAFIMSVSSACLAGFLIGMKLWIFDTSDDDIGWVPLCFLVTYMAAYSIGLGPVPWILMGEIFSAKVKPYGVSITVATHWLTVVTVSNVPKVITVDEMFIGVSACCAFVTLFVMVFVSEPYNINLSTKAKSKNCCSSITTSM